MMPLVSICMPAFNAAEYIDETIQSVLNQTYQNIELIICNDGSTDNTAEVLLKYSTYPNIKIVNTENRGQCAAANKAYKHSSGEFIKFFDADDVMNPEHINEQLQRLIPVNNCIAAGQIKRFYKNDINTALHEPLENWLDLKPMDWLINGNGHGLGMMQCGMFLIPRHFIQKEGAWNESLSLINDFEFFPRLLLQADKVLFTQNAKVYYRSGIANNLSSETSKEKLLSAFNALEITTRRLLQYENTERVKRGLSFYWHFWKYNFYLEDKALYNKTVLHIRALGNIPDIYFNNMRGRLSKIVGWKNHKRIMYFLNRLRGHRNNRKQA
jgi:glycosyltransferase involved in cell wall biosynthesis